MRSHGHVVQVAVVAGKDGHHLLRGGHRLELRLLKKLDHAGAALELGLRGLVQVRGEHGERLHLAVLGEV